MFDDLFAQMYPSLVEVYGEEIIYTPVGGSPRPISAIVTGAQSLRDGEHVVEETENLEVDVSTDEVEGISSPRIGDTILRDSAHDPLQREFGWTGEIIKNHNTRLILRFSRHVRLRVGAARGTT